MPQTQSVGQMVDTNQAYRPRALLRYKRTDTFDEQLKLGGTFVKATITFDEAPDAVVMTRMHRHISHRLKADLGSDDNLSPLSEAEVTMGHGHFSKQNDRIDIFSDRLTLDDIRITLRMALHRYRNGDGYEVTPVTAEQHAQMVAYGVKLRKDGLFGYHLLCAREACTEHVGTCYTQTDLDDAIYDKQQRRSRFSCSTYCWLKETSPFDISEEWYECLDTDLRNDLDPFIEWEDEMDGDDAIRTVVGIDIDRLKAEAPDLLKRFGSALSDHCEYMDDAGESSCET